MFIHLNSKLAVNLKNVNYIEIVGRNEAVYHFSKGETVNGPLVDNPSDVDVHFCPPPKGVIFLIIEKDGDGFKFSREILAAIKIEYNSSSTDVIGLSLSGLSTNESPKDEWFVLEDENGVIYTPTGVYPNLDVFLELIK